MGQTGGFSQIKKDDWPDLNNALRRIFERLDGVEGRRGSTVRGADLNMGGFKGINADAPTDDGDLVTKGYADDHYGPTNIALQLAFGGSNPLNINQLIGRSAEPQIPAFTNFTTLPPVTLYQPDSTIVVNGVVYRLDGSTDPATWVAVNSPGLSGTHASRLANAATKYAIGSPWWETDRTVTYLVQTVSAVNTWIYADGVMVNTFANRPVDLGTNDARFRFLATDTAQHFRWTGTAWVEEQEISNAVTAAVTTLLNLIHRSTGTPAANFGAALAFLLDSSTNVLRNAGYLDFIWTTATNGSESAALVVKLMAAGAAAAEVLRVNGDGTASLVGDLTIPGEAYGAGWDGSNEATTKNDVYDKMEAVVASIAALLTLAAGTYTPILTNVLNLDASTAFSCQYLRVGNSVTVSGRVDADPTGAGSVELGISLPIASNLVNVGDCAGVAACPNVAGQVAAILADGTNDRARMNWVAVNTTNQQMYFTFTYRIA